MTLYGYKLKNAYIGGEYEINKIRLGTNQARPEEKYNRQLYKETNFKNSSYGGFLTGGWGSSTSPTSTAFNTSEGYIYNNGSHGSCKLTPQLNDFNLFNNAKAIKIVCDGMYVANNTNTYQAEFWICGSGFLSRSSYALRYYNLTKSSGDNISNNTRYTYEYILEKGKNGILNISNGSVCQSSLTWDNIITQSSGGIFYPSYGNSRAFMCGIVLDQGTSMRMKDVHVYIAN